MITHSRIPNIYVVLSKCESIFCMGYIWKICVYHVLSLDAKNITINSRVYNLPGRFETRPVNPAAE